MKNICLVLLKLAFVFMPVTLYAEDSQEDTFNNMAIVYCAANKVDAEKCFNLNEPQCESVMSSIVNQCGLSVGVFPIISTDTNALEAFDLCLGDELEKYLLSIGRSLTDSCSP